MPFQRALNAPGEELDGKLAVAHQFVEMANEVVPKYDPVTGTFDIVSVHEELCFKNGMH